MGKSAKDDTSSGPFASAYPSIAQWVEDGGYVEIGQTCYEELAFVKALDEGGMIWAGETEYSSVDAALRALDAGIAAFLEENG